MTAARALLVVSSLALAVLGAGAAVAAGLGYRWDAWPLSVAFALLRGGVYGGLAAAALALAAGALALATRSWRHLLWAVPALALGLATAAVPWTYLQAGREAPRIHDLTTDTENPPQFVAILPLRADAPNPAAYGGPEIARQQRQAYPDLGPLRLESPPAEVFASALAVAKDMGWDMVAEVPSEGRIEATATTFWFGFEDDVVVRIAPQEGGTRVDLRSVSRVGVGDLGVNAQRIRAFLAKLKEAVG